MPEIREQLIELYAGQPVAEVISTPAYQKLLTVNDKNEQFKFERDQVEKAQSRLENLFARKPNAVQVGTALKELKQQRIAAKEALYLALIEKGYKPHWSTPQQDYFDRGCKLINLTYQYFLSFTTRYPPPPGENPANERYKYFIRDVLTTKRANNIASTENRLAHALHQYLSEASRKGFFFPDYQYDNSETLKKLKAALASSVFFIQLVQNIMFEAPMGATNFSFFEYDQAVATIPEADRLPFVIAESDRKKLVKEFNVSADYAPWYTCLVSKDPPYLPGVDELDKRQGKALKELLFSKIIQPLDDFWENLFRNVPL